MRRMKIRRLVIYLTFALSLLSACGRPTPIVVPTVIPSTPTREFISMIPGPAVLQDKLGYFRSVSDPIATAFPKNPDDMFLLIISAIPVNSTLYPEDLDWRFLDETNREIKSIGFAIPHTFEVDPKLPVIYTFFGRLLGGPVVVRSNSDKAVIVLVFVVPKGISEVTLLSPQRKEYSFSVLNTALSMDSGLIPVITCDSCTIELPNGSENWTFTP